MSISLSFFLLFPSLSPLFSLLSSSSLLVYSSCFMALSQVTEGFSYEEGMKCKQQDICAEGSSSLFIPTYSFQCWPVKRACLHSSFSLLEILCLCVSHTLTLSQLLSLSLLYLFHRPLTVTVSEGMHIFLDNKCSCINTKHSQWRSQAVSC